MPSMAPHFPSQSRQNSSSWAIRENSIKTPWGSFANVQGSPIFFKKNSQNDILCQVSSRIIILIYRRFR